MNDPSIEVTLLVTAVLEELNIDYVIGGSLASALHGVARATLDSDLVAALEPKHVPLLVQRLQPAFYIFDEAIYDAIEHRSSFNLIHLESMFKVDIFVPQDREFDRAQLAHGQSYVVGATPDQQARIASAEDTLLAKLAWYQMGGQVSDRQWQDVLGILRVQVGRLDEAYLKRMADSLGVTELLRRALEETDQGVAS